MQYPIWAERPPVVQNLFNPAFCSLLIWKAVSAYNDTGMDYALTYIVLPLVLHRRMRHSLPSTVRTTLPVWIQRHPEYLLIFPQLVREMVPFTADGLLWAANAGRLRMSDPNCRVTSLGQVPATASISDDRILEVSDCVDKAALLGKWLARSGTTSVVFGLLGIRP
jgi:ABC-3C biological conflict system middle component